MPASQAYSRSSGGAACPGAIPKSQGVISRRFKRNKNFVTNGQTDVLVEIVLQMFLKQ